MSYAYEYTEGLKQFGMVHLILKFNDSDNILPEITIPVVLDESEYSGDKIDIIANQIINSFSSPLPVIEEEPLPVIEEEEKVEDGTNNLLIE